MHGQPLPCLDWGFTSKQLPMPYQPTPIGDVVSQGLSQLLYRCFEEGNASKAALYLSLEPGGSFRLASHFGWPRHEPPPMELGPSAPLVLWLRRERHALAVNYPDQPVELEHFRAGSDAPRFLIHPLYHRGDMIGFMVERDLLRGLPFELARDVPIAQPILEGILAALEEFRLLEPIHPLTPPKEPTPITVTVPPSASRQVAPVNGLAAGPSAATPSADPDEFVGGETLSGLEEDLIGTPQTRRRNGLFLPEQRTYFWETCRLLFSFLPLGAAALWMDDAKELRPMLLYSRLPLGDDLKRQALGALAAHVPTVPPSQLRALSQAEQQDREPLQGPFLTYLPIVLKEAEGAQDLLLLFRMEDRPFTSHEQTFLRHVARILGFHIQEMRIHEGYHRAFLSVSQRMLASAEGRIPDIRHHSVAIAKLARKLAVKLDLPASDVEAVSIAAILHDVGTVFLDPELLAKPHFTEEDRARVQTHPMLSTSFLKDFRFPFDVLSIIRHHHERWDGKGYPDGLSGEQIPLGSRIIALAETFEVMSTGRAYKEPCPLNQTLEELTREAGRQFDPALVPVFLQLVSR